jgi:hypothetical protein
MILTQLLTYNKQRKVIRLYYFALSFYVLPFIFLTVFVIDQLTFDATEMYFWVIFLISLAPCGLLGVSLCTWGLVKAFKRKSQLNKVLGFFGLAIGLGGICAGVLGFLLIYVVVQ